MAGKRLVVVSERDHYFIDVDDATTIRVGRAPDNDIVVKDDMVSRRHAQIEIDEAGAIRVRDLKSFNGTYLNEKRIRDEALEMWIALRIGRTKMFLVDRIADAAASTSSSAEELMSVEEMGATQTMEVDEASTLGALMQSKEARTLIDDVVRREREELERQISRRIRDESGPSVLSSLRGFKVRVRRAGPIDGGGDFFDVFKDSLRPHELTLAVGSVSGVGIAACVAATTARHTLRGACALGAESDPRSIVESAREVLTSTLHPGSAMSIALAKLSDTGKMEVGCMGGTGVLLYKAATETVEVLRPPGRRDEEAVRPVRVEALLKDGDTLILASDGGGSLRRTSGDPYGAKRLADTLATLAHKSETTKELLSALINDYVEYADGAPERDVCLIAVARVPE